MAPGVSGEFPLNKQIEGGVKQGPVERVTELVDLVFV